MSKRAYPVWNYSSNTKTNPIPPVRSSQGRSAANPAVGIPQGQTSKTGQGKPPNPEDIIPVNRQLYREVIEAQNAAPRYPETTSPKQSVLKPMNRQEQRNSELLNRKQKETLPQQKQTLPRQKLAFPKRNMNRPDALRKIGYRLC